jgi:two-component system chemotaxis response regulator CheY
MAVDLTKPVLVVDDYNTMIHIMHNLLKQLGFEPNYGSSALAKLRKREYKPVISY